MKTRCCESKKFHEIQNEYICSNSVCSNYLGTTEVISKGCSKQIIAASFIVMFVMFSPKNDNNSFGLPRTEARNEPTKEAVAVQVPLTLENVEAEIQANNILCPDQVFAQIKIESGYLSSYLLKKTNNMLGMRYPFKRPTTACGIYIPELDTIIKADRAELRKYAKYPSYAVFNTWQDAIKDYKLWQDYSFNLTKVYLDFLKRNYAEDTAYVQKIKYVVRKELANAK